MYNAISLQWKEFNIDLEAVVSKVKQDFPINYSGCSAADGYLEIWLENATEQMVSDIQAYWAGLTAQSPEAQGYRSFEQRASAIKNAKDALVSKSWDQMSGAERKLVLGLPVTNQELISAGLL